MANLATSIRTTDSAGRLRALAPARPSATPLTPRRPLLRSRVSAGVCQMFEKRLKEIYPNLKDITYDISDLYNYIDALADLSALVFDPSTNTYAPHNKDWVKKKAFAHLKKQAGRR